MGYIMYFCSLLCIQDKIISLRIDTLWRMIGRKLEGRLPEIDEEGATGKYDNKGAIVEISPIKSTTVISYPLTTIGK